jgi:protein arginine N-methyltransferase 1
MIADRGRTAAYAAALRSRITPGCVVLDIGTGTGILALLAIKYGAGKVYAVEADNIVHVAREAARANGVGDRIEFIQGLSDRISLPEKVDGVVAEIHGALPQYQGGASVLMDARDRLLRPGGWMIPQQETMWAALVDVPGVYAHYVDPWDVSEYGIDLDLFRRRAVNVWRSESITEDCLIVPPQCWATLDYLTIQNPNVHGELEWIINETRDAQGIGVWFDSEEADGIGFSNSPFHDRHVFGRAFFPWSSAVKLQPGDQVHVTLRSDLVGPHYVWRWNTRIISRTGQLTADFRQSSFYGSPVSLDQLSRRANDYVPSLNAAGVIEHLVLGRMAEGIALQLIASELTDRFPERFASVSQAMARVAELSMKFSE